MLFDPTGARAQQKLAYWRTQGLAGVDEAGRGPLAGPVCAAAVVLPASFELHLAQDSKTLSQRRRVAADQAIRASALAFGVGWAEVAEIDEHNILQATYLAMRRALQNMGQGVPMVLVDGNRLPPLTDLCGNARAVVKGDAQIPEIGAASILAKVARDALMVQLDQRYPGYGFAQHKGYGTQAHRRALLALGPCDIHRRSFSPVRAALRSTQEELDPVRAALRSTSV